MAFYDFRRACPTRGGAILAANRGKAGTCIALTLQAYRDTGATVAPVGGNLLASKTCGTPTSPTALEEV